jgi:hypothetical protein
MPDTNPPPTKLHEARGLRLKIAVQYHYRRAADFADILARDGVVERAAFYSHLSGTKWPDGKTLSRVREYEARLGMPVGWIHDGRGEDVEDLRRALDLLKDDEGKAQIRRLFPFFPLSRTEESAVNQQLEESGADSGKISKIRHIPILPDGKIEAWLSGERALDMMAAQTIPILLDGDIGPRAFGYVVGRDDHSMASATARSFPPGTVVVIDPDRPITPGNYVLAKPKTKRIWMLRLYRAALEYDGSQPYTLEASNPAFEAIRVADPAGWEIAGRAVKIIEDI